MALYTLCGLGDAQPINSTQRSRRNFVVTCRSKAAAWKVCFENPSKVKNMHVPPTPLAQLWCENTFGGEAVTWLLQVLRPDLFFNFY